MQLILPQSELEQAITEYVHGIMNIKDGHTMTIDLKAGRGLDGFTATVDITKAGGIAPVKTVVPAALFVPQVQTMKVVPRPEPATVEPKEENTILVVNDPVAVPSAEVKAVDTKSEQPQAAVETETVAASGETEAVTATPVRRPLFGNLKKPE